MTDFENLFDDSIEEIRARLIATIEDLYPNPATRPDIREGSLLWAFFAMMAVEAQTGYTRINEALEQSFLQYAVGEYLDYKGVELDLERNAATEAGGEVRFMGTIGTLVPAATAVATTADTVGDVSQRYDTTESGTVEGFDDPVDEPTVAEGGAGNITGDLVYKYVYVTNLNALDEERGFTAPSPPSADPPTTPVLTVSAKEVVITVPQVTAGSGALTDVDRVEVYRSYKPIGEPSFSEYKKVGEITSGFEGGGTVDFTDDMTDADFELLDEEEFDIGLPTSNTTGLVDIPVIAQEAGLAGNVDAQAINLLEDDTPGIEKITNPLAFTGGADIESDDDYRIRLLEEIRISSGAGNVDDYISWAKEVDGILGASCLPEWDGPGTVKVIIAGEGNTEITDADKIEEVRQHISGDIAVDGPSAALTGVPDTAGGDLLAGTYQYVYTFVTQGGAGETTVSPASVQHTTTGSTSKIDLTIPAVTLLSTPPIGEGPTLITARRIYRREIDAETDYELVTEITNNATTTYADITAQADLPAGSLDARIAPIINSTSMYNGEAPIGAHVTIVTIEVVLVSVTATIIPEDGYTVSGETGKINLAQTLHDNLNAFFQSLAPGVDVIYKDIENVIHDTDGVADFRDVELTAPGYAGVTTNIEVNPQESTQYDDASSVWTEATS